MIIIVALMIFFALIPFEEANAKETACHNGISYTYNPNVEITNVSYDDSSSKVFVFFHISERFHRVKVSSLGRGRDVFIESIVYCNIYDIETGVAVFTAKRGKEDEIKQIGISDFMVEIMDY